MQQSPAPNSYHVADDSIAKNTLISAQAAFRSRTQRQPCLLHALSNPGPGQYDVKMESVGESSCPQRAVFMSNTKRGIPLDPTPAGPGPADYKPTQTPPRPPLIPFHKQKHYLCISAPAIPLPPRPPPPGPGHYETQQPSEVQNQLVSGAVFKSTTSWWGRQPAIATQPGPGETRLSVCLPVCLSVYLSVCLSVYLFASGRVCAEKSNGSGRTRHSHSLGHSVRDYSKR